ncbi:hypothetical protein ALC62_14532 [Cyphomyrmex costatus]|uniref:Uncharacterized protein n=1 Tax=Cyphomyrmex costatus TaxID=456900 RepID=A0A195C284_9HYME|nr:hypothetical protein ALC62_14532 [Cyphomyrmex costatus]
MVVVRVATENVPFLITVASTTTRSVTRRHANGHGSSAYGARWNRDRLLKRGGRRNSGRKASRRSVWGREKERRRNKSGKNESIGGVFHDAPLEALQVGERNRRSQADLGPPFCDNGREGVCLSDWLIYGLLSSWTSFYRLFGCTHRRVLQPPGNPATLPPHTVASPTPLPTVTCSLSPLRPSAVSSGTYIRTYVRVHAHRSDAKSRVAEESSRKIANGSYMARSRARFYLPSENVDCNISLPLNRTRLSLSPSFCRTTKKHVQTDIIA